MHWPESVDVARTYRAFTFLCASAVTFPTGFAVPASACLRYARLIDSPYDPTEAAINTWAAGLSGDLNRTLAATPLSVTISGDNGVSLGDSVTLHGHVSSKWSDPFRLVWRDDERGVVAIGVQELILKPERPGIMRVTLDVCEAGDPQAAVSIGSSDRVVCPGVLASASHIVVVDTPREHLCENRRTFPRQPRSDGPGTGSRNQS